MAMSKEYTKDRYSRTKKLQEDEEESMRTVCINVAQGGSLIDLCKTWDVLYGEMASWIRADKVRNRRYIDSLNDRAEWYVEKIKSELNKIASVDIRGIFNDDGSVKKPAEWPEDISCVIKDFKVMEREGKDGLTRTYDVKMWSKEKGLELLGKNLSMYIDRHEHSGSLTLEDIVAGSRHKDGKE